MSNTQDSAAMFSLSPYSPNVNVTNQTVTHALDKNLYIISVISVLRSTPPQRRTCVCNSAYIYICTHTHPHTHVCVCVTPHVRVTVRSR